MAASVLIAALALTLTAPPNPGAIVPRSSSTATRAATYLYQYISTPGVRGRAFGVSDDRTVVGYYVALNDSALLPFVYHYGSGSDAAELPLEQGFAFGIAYNISPDAQYIVGSEQTPGSSDPCYAVLWTKMDGGYTPSRLVAGRNNFDNEATGSDCSSYGAAVTSDGTVYIHDGTTSGAGWVWTAATGAVHQDQLDVPGRTVATDGTHLVSNGTTASEVPAQGTAVALQPLTAGNQESANAISLGNDEIVGSSLYTGTPLPNEPNLTTLPHAVRWDSDGHAVDLNDVTAYESSDSIATVDSTQGWSNPEGVTLSGALGLNEAGDIVGSAYNSLRSQGQEAPMLLLAMPPVVIVPGVAASHLVSGTGQELWLNATGNHSNLALSGPGSTPVAYGDRVLQYETAACHFHFTCPADLAAYGPWMDFMHSNGFVDYQNSLQVSCDTSQRTANPNLFTFAYDWRRDNADTAQTLAHFMQCVRKFYTGPVVMVAHSMGGLVARRYILDQGAQSHVRELATIGTPWLGAPKLVNAMLTGEFASPIVLADTLQRVLPSMPGPRELLPSADYYQVLPTDQYGSSLPPFAEAGWDINGDQKGVVYPTENYTDAQLHQLISTQVPGYDSVAAAADTFHAVPGQDNWQKDTSNVHYTVMYGQQSVDRTIGQVQATTVPRCDGGGICTVLDTFRTTIVPGDGTVPVVSSSRQGNGNDLNNPDPTHERLIAVSGSDDDLEHTGLTHNPEVDNEILYLDGRLGFDPVTDGPASPSTTLALARTGTSSGGGLVTASSVTSVADTQSAAGGWYAEVSGFTGTTTISDPSGTSDAPQADTGDIRPELDGVTHENEGDGAELAITPVPTSGAYTDTFTAGQSPLAVDVRQGQQSTPSSRTGWQDLVLPAGSTVHLSLPASGTPTLSYTAPGSTDPVTVLPTTSLSGPEATYGVVPPALQASAVVRNGTTYGVLSASSNGVAPVTGIRWSLDGVHFQTYTGPVALGPTSSTLSAFADDAAGNRSSVYTFDTSTMTAAPYTDATLVPQPGPSGFSAVPVTAVLQPHSSDGTSAVLHYTVYPPTGPIAPEQTSTAPVTRIVVSANGKTTIRYYTVDSTGAQETAKYLVVGVDTSSPAVAITSPAANATTAGFPAVSGTATDTASGVTGVQVSIRRNSDGQYWSGTGWQPGYTSLPTSGTGTWQVPSASLPQGSNASPGAYTIAATATSLSGTTGTGHVQITVSPSAAIRELAPPASGFSSNNPTAALAVNAAGQVAGDLGQIYQGAYQYALRWNADGSATALSGGQNMTLERYAANAINDQGVAVGHGPNGAYVWRPDGTMQQLRYGGTGACASCDNALAINGSGVVAGQSVNRWGTWTGTGGTFVPLPVPPGPSSTMDALTFQPMGINSSGTVVGTRLVTGPDGRNRYVATEATTQSAHYLFPVTSESHAMAIDTAGDVVGSAVPAGAYDLQPYIQTPDGTTTFLDLSGIGLGTGTATGINDSGEIVGTGTDSNGVSQAWIWRGGVVKRLADLLPAGSGWTLGDASGISSTGIVVGRGQLNGNQRGYALTPAGDLQLDTPIDAQDASATTPVDTAVTIPLVARTATTRSITWAVTQSPAHGTAAVTGAQLTYTPDSGWTGTETLGVQATDGVLTSNPATVTIQVGTPATAPGAPVALIDAPAGVGDGAPFTLDGSASFDPGGAALTYVWSVADGSVTDPGAAVTSATLSGPGPHLVTLTVTGPGGNDTASMTVTAAPVPAPNTSIAVTVTGSSTYGGTAAFDYSTAQKLPSGVTLTGTVTCTGESDGTPVSAAQHVGSYTIGGTSCSGLTASAAGYSITYEGGSLTVSPAPLTATVTGSQVYGSAQRSFAVSDWSGFVNGDDPATAVTGTLAGCSSTAAAGGPAAEYSGTITGCGGLSAADYLIGYQDGGFTITPAPLVITASSAAITYGQPIPAITPAYSGFANGDGPDSLATAPSCATTANGDSAAGVYATSCAGAADPDYAISYAPGTLTVGRRDAVLAYTGPQLVSTATATASTATVALTATVTPDSTDGYSGDLTHAAPVTFDLFSSTNTAMTTPDATCTATQVTASGTATCQTALAPDTWTVTVVEPANGYYDAPTSESAVVTVYQPIPGTSVTGGGWVLAPATTASPSAPAQVPHDNFGFTVRYHKGSTAPQGQSLYVFRGSDGYDYVVKSNSWQGGGLAISGNKATFMGKATVTVVDPATGQQVIGLGGGNYTFRVDVTDNGSGGSGDTYAISVYDATGTLVHQNGSPTQQLPLGGGNIAVRAA